MARGKRRVGIVLCIPGTGVTGEFDFEHAERLLDMPDEIRGGWAIPEDSEYYYDEEYGIRLKSDKGGGQPAEAQ